MRLHVTEMGSGSPLIMLHGLFGQGRNWQRAAKLLSSELRTLALDLRNHGASPHGEPMDYPTMAADVAETMDHLGLSRAAVVGHSMGGKVAMALALAEPLRVTTLVVADTAPAAHSGNHHALVQAMLAVDLRSAARRADVDAALASRVPDGVVRAFLLQGVVTGPDGGLTWRNNLRVLDRSMATISGFPVFPANATYLGPVLFVAGGRSTYLRPEHRAVIGGLFPAATYVTLEGAGHWVHADRPEVFSRLVREHVLGERG